jgi:GR25 family glycosyltransferase involved in LPS biosynthesis
MKVDKIYIVSLEAGNPVKQKEIVGKLDILLEDHPSVGYEIVQAYDGRNGKVPEYCTPYANWKIEGHENDWWNRDILGGEVGCSISHYMCWQKQITDNEETCLILEEDFFPVGKLIDLVLPKVEWDLAWLGRYVFDAESEKQIDQYWVRPNRSYNTHAYVIKKKTAETYLNEYDFINNLVPLDEFTCATFYEHPREDISKLFPVKIKSIALKDEIVIQKRPDGESTVENSEPISTQIESESGETFEILDTSDWEAWKEKYVNLTMAQGEYDLMLDDLGNNIYEFQLFTPKFCKEAIALAETLDNWTQDRHEFYPTNDVLLKDIRLQDIYHRVLKEIVYPLCIHIWHLEGHRWKDMYSENFMIRYTTERQSHLSLHHDFSDISMVVKLNDEFEGGGTWFPRYNTLSNPSKIGTASLHPGRVTHRHGARPISAGKRYIAVSFMRQEK